MEQLKVLVACEESQRVCKSFRKRGHIAYSCDILPCSGECPEWHIKGDCLPLLNGDCVFKTSDGIIHTVDKWDLIIAHPPCTYLTIAGNRWFDIEKYGDKAKKRLKDRESAIEFFMRFTEADCEHIAIENPIGCISTFYKKPDQVIQPYQFGDGARKATCLWLKNLPKLQPTKLVNPGVILKGGYSSGASADYAIDENGKILSWNDPRTAIIRSKTFPGIAEAFGEQWGNFVVLCKLGVFKR